MNALVTKTARDLCCFCTGSHEVGVFVVFFLAQIHQRRREPEGHRKCPVGLDRSPVAQGLVWDLDLSYFHLPRLLAVQSGLC